MRRNSLPTKKKKKVSIALSIAGSDSSGGAGIQADLKTFTVFGVFGTSVITALTAQNTSKIQKIKPVEIEIIKNQIDSVCSDFAVNALKTGMLVNESIIKLVCKMITKYKLTNIVVDPVMISKTGNELLDKNSISCLIEKLFPLATLITPNLEEAQEILKLKEKIKTIKEMKEIARLLKNLGPKAVLLKGGHLQSGATDILCYGSSCYTYEGKFIDTENTHGTGCTLSSAITCGLANGLSLRRSIKEAKDFIQKCIKSSFDIGSGKGPLNHMHFLKKKNYS